MYVRRGDGSNAMLRPSFLTFPIELLNIFYERLGGLVFQDLCMG